MVRITFPPGIIRGFLIIAFSGWIQNGMSMRGNAKTAYLGESIDQMIYQFMEAHGIPGLTLAIVQAPYIPRVVGYGETEIKNGRLAAANSLYAIGPIAQGYNAVAVMQLYEAKKLDIYAPVSHYLPDLPAAWRPVSLFQLLQHSSGITDYREVASFSPTGNYSPEELIEMTAAAPLLFEPGTAVRQSATNFLLLSLVVEKVSGIRYEDFVIRHQIEYLGLKDTWFARDLGKVKQEDLSQTNGIHSLFKKDKAYISPAEVAAGYQQKEGVPVPVIPSVSLKGFADLWASAENVSYWDIALAGSVLIKEAANRDLIYKPTRLANGQEVPAMAGWQFYHHKGLMDIKGSVAGFSAYLSRFTDASELVCVTLLSNQEGIDFTNLARKIAAAFDSDKMGSGINDTLLYSYESQFSADETMARIEHNLREAGVKIFAKYNHAREASDVGLALRPTQVIVFGSPKVGTKLMQLNQSIAVELPLRVAVWEDQNGSVWLAFPQMQVFAQAYQLEGNPVLAAMQRMLEKLVQKSASVY